MAVNFDKWLDIEAKWLEKTKKADNTNKIDDFGSNLDHYETKLAKMTKFFENTSKIAEKQRHSRFVAMYGSGRGTLPDPDYMYPSTRSIKDYVDNNTILEPNAAFRRHKQQK